MGRQRGRVHWNENVENTWESLIQLISVIMLQNPPKTPTTSAHLGQNKSDPENSYILVVLVIQENGTTENPVLVLDK